MNIILVIPSNTGTIASVSYDLYRGLCKQPEITVYVACLGSYKEDGFQFDNIYKLGERKVIIAKVFTRMLCLRRIKKENNIKISISTLLGATYWNVLSGIGEMKIGIFHTKLEQRKSAGKFTYFASVAANYLLCSHLDKFIAVNRSAYLDLKKLQKGKDIELVYNIHDFAKIEKNACLDLTDEKEQNIFCNPVILYVGGLYIGVKGSDRLVKAFAKVHTKHPNYQLVFIGSDDDDSLTSLKRIIDENKLADSIHFLGRKENPYKYMKRALMLVSPSRDEGLPGVLIEALSIGVKCVATNSSIGVWEIMQCSDGYEKDLNEIVETKFGFITPNKLDDEDFTVDKISEAIELCIKKKEFDKSSFNKERFSEKEVIPHYLKFKRNL